MGFIFKTFLKRIPREGFRSLTVPALALVLVVLISVMSGIRIGLEVDLEYVIENFEVRVELSNPVTSETDYLNIENRFVRMFTDEDTSPYLSQFVGDVELKRSLNIVGVDMVEETVGVGQLERTAERELIVPGQLVGITSKEAERRLSSLGGGFIDFFEGYDESIFRTGRSVAVASSNLFGALNPANPILSISVQSGAFDPQHPFAVYPAVNTELVVVGISHGVGNDVIAPFWAVANLGTASDNFQTYSDIMFTFMADNRQIGEFGAAATGHFARAGDVGSTMPHALTVFDSVFNDVVHRLNQNIQLIDVATPFIYLILVLIGFIASFLLTRRRKPEFAIMRSIGVNRKDVFFGALMEQAVLCASGAILGLLLFWAVFGDIIWTVPLLFITCYVLGAVLSVQKTAGANVLKILSDKE